MKVAVTGAGGFVGRHVVAELERRGVSITALLRPSSPVPAWCARHKLVALDVLTAPANAYELAGRPDVLIHLAWGGLPNYQSLHHFEAELPAQYKFLNGMVRAGLGALVVAGTCYEYGMQSGPLSERADARPGNPYGLAKDVLRRQLVELKRQAPFAFTWARLFYLHGDGQAAGSLLAQLKAAVARGETVFPMSGGEQLRDYLPVADAARHLVQLAVTRRDNGVVNVCSGRPISVRKLVEGWIAERGWTIQLDLGRHKYTEHAPMAYWGDRRKLDRCLTQGEP